MKYIRVFESFSIIDEIGDYFTELSDHSNDSIPITVEVTDHKINKKVRIKGELQYFRKANPRQKYIILPKIDGYKIYIIYDMYDHVYVDKVVNTALSRLRKDYNIHYNQVSKQGNGYTIKEIPIHNSDKTYTVHDQKWKRTITLSPKLISESVNIDKLEIVEDFLDMCKYNNELDIDGYYRHTFDIFTKSIVGDNSRSKQQILYGNITNADIMMTNSESIVKCVVSLISFNHNDIYSKGLSSTNYLLSRLQRLVKLIPDIIIFSQIISSTGSIGNRPNSNVYEIVFFINPIK